MTPAEELRTAATRARCDHRFPVQPPEGSLAAPGNCRACGQSWERREVVSDELAEPLADWLDEQARQYNLPPCNDPTGVCNRCEYDPSILAAQVVARAINGGAQ